MRRETPGGRVLVHEGLMRDVSGRPWYLCLGPRALTWTKFHVEQIFSLLRDRILLALL